MEWKLTDEEILAKSTDQFEYCELALETGKWARDEQAKKLVVCVEKKFASYSPDSREEDAYYTILESDWQELRRQVGLE